MYRSSSLTLFYKYLFTPIWGGMFLFGIVFSWNMNDSFSHDWSRIAALMVGWALIWLIIMMIRLKRVEVTQDNLVIKSLGGQKTVDYKDVEWICQIAFINPIMISLKYSDKESGESKKILIIPGMSSQLFKFNFFGELDITKFIRERLVAFKPNYSKELEPSRWLPAGLIFLSGIPIFIVMTILSI
ncbi:hypothetical protein [Marinilabilia sp.]|uniref:hypothetical protein n=1 Tax=Marinilabilia sp. TaxID=2021252 RepID=UPI0025C11E3A|nr:hypothetical protein [Marinilabilia sp.]